MTIAALDKEIKAIIDKHSVYGAECVLQALVRACKDKQYLGGANLRQILNDVITLEEEHEKEDLT